MCFSIKPLEWDERNRADVYGVKDCYGQGPKRYFLYRASTIIGWFDGIEAAKAAAQADYEARVRSALVPTPAPQGMDTVPITQEAADAWMIGKWPDPRLTSTPQPAPSLNTPWGWVCSGEGDGWKETDKLVRDPELVARYRGNPNWHTIVPLYPQPAPSGVNAEMLAALDDFIQGGENCSGPVNDIHLKHLREWRRAIAAAEAQPAAVGWQTMDSAPKDGTRILIKTVTFGWNSDICQNVATGDKAVESRWAKNLSNQEAWLEWCGSERIFSTDGLVPICWMPLPTAPKQGGE